MKKWHIIGGTLSIAMLVVAFVGCAKKADSGKEQVVEPQEKAKKAAPKSKGEIKTDGPKPVPPKIVNLSASHVLIMHNESKRKPPEVTRTKEEALSRIKEAEKKIAAGADFADVAKEYSECPSKEKGGDLGMFASNRMVPEFSKATQDLKEGGVSKPVETMFGYHLIKRQKVEEAHARIILIMHKDLKRKPPTVTRTKEEAKKAIDEVLKKLKSPEADFAALAKEYSDHPSKQKGGDLGKITRGRIPPDIEKAVFAMKENNISDIIETDFGYVIAQRLP